MKKSIIISAVIVLMIAAVCITAFAFWDTTERDVSFDAANAVGQGVKFTVAKGDAAEAALLIPSGAIKNDNEKTEIMIGSAILKYEAPGSDATALKNKVASFTPSITKFVLGDNDITANWSDVFEVWISTSASNSATDKTIIGTANSSDAYVVSDSKAYTYMKFKKDAANIDSKTYAELKFTIDITFTIA